MFYWNSLKNLRYLKRANFYPTSKHKLRVLFRPEAEIQPRTVPQIDDAEERKVFEKVPDEMADKLTEIINEAIPWNYFWRYFADILIITQQSFTVKR